MREFAITLQKALIFSRGGPLLSEDILDAATDHGINTAVSVAGFEDHLRTWIKQEIGKGNNTPLFESTMDRFDAILLGLSRPTLHAKIDKYHLSFQTSVKRSPQNKS